MITNIIYFMTAFIAFQIFSQGPDPYGFFTTVAGILLMIAAAALIGFIRAKKLTKEIISLSLEGTHAGLGIVEKWRSGFQFSIIVVYIGILIICRWGIFINKGLGLSNWVFIGDLLGLLPYGILLFISWSISYFFQNAVGGEHWTYKGYILFNMQITVTPVIPILIYTGLLDAIYYLPYPFSLWLGRGSEFGEFIVALFFLFVIGFLFPLFLVVVWACKPLEQGPKRHLLESVCRSKGLKYRNIMVWDIGEGKFINAGIMGITRHFRYILFTRKILDVLTDEELTAVLGHEIGHSKKNHIFLNMLISLGFMSSFIFVSEIIGPLLGGANSALFIFLSTIGFVLLYWRVIFGFISRRFEREADLYGIDTVGSAEPMIAALEKIAVVSGRPRNAPNWTHYSISERVSFLKRVKDHPSVGKAFLLDTRKFIRKVVFAACLMLVFSMAYLAYHARINPSIINSWFAEERYVDIERYILNELKDTDLSDHEKADHYNNLAWLYATSRDADYLKPSRALYYAEKAIDITVQKLEQDKGHTLNTRIVLATYVDTLAASYYALGDNSSAVHYSEVAVGLIQHLQDHPAYHELFMELFANFEKFNKSLKYGDIPL